MTLPLYVILRATGTGNLPIDGFISGSGSLVVPAGTYNPYVACTNFSSSDFTGRVQVYGVTLNVITSPA